MPVSSWIEGRSNVDTHAAKEIDPTDIRSVVFIGRTWFTSAGYTEHAVEVFVDGRRVGWTTEPVAGSGRAYLETGCAILLRAIPLLPDPPKGIHPSRYLDALGVTWADTVVPVGRRRDL